MNDNIEQNEQTLRDEHFMSLALALAEKAEKNNEIPVGAVVVANDKVIGEGFNQSIMNHDPSAHAEMIAVRSAAKTIENYRMLDCTLYVTLEPCPMCAGLLVHSRIKRVVYGAADEKTGAAGSVFSLTHSDKLNHQLEVTSGILAKECSTMLSNFFKRRRKEIKQKKLAEKTNNIAAIESVNRY